MRKKLQYPFAEELENQRRVFFKPVKEEEPDFVDGKPNYDKFEGWSPEEVLVWLNID